MRIGSESGTGLPKTIFDSVEIKGVPMRRSEGKFDGPLLSVEKGLSDRTFEREKESRSDKARVLCAVYGRGREFELESV